MTHWLFVKKVFCTFIMCLVKTSTFHLRHLLKVDFDVCFLTFLFVVLLVFPFCNLPKLKMLMNCCSSCTQAPIMSLMFNLICVLPSGPKLARIQALKKSLPLHCQKFKAENVSIVIYFSTYD